ncbi:MAG: FtsX-like permease family protein [Spirochaetales bacterium]|uniref:FtsX-like permease family protein n=1 Tax=Candidatus Thalassospirochaeta sargassi TaxID=3119039 RepID=A0AAJ1ILS3_9SPIO|nr:FtsX-like permease family protein [Spirochaetales bacterium]
MTNQKSVPVVWKIATRNLIEHKTKTLIIGAIVAIGMLVLILGNAILDTATAGIEKNYIENFTGDVILSGETENGIFFFAMEQMRSGDESETPITPDYFEIKEYLDSSNIVESWSPLISGMATMMFTDEIIMPTQIFGVDIEKYTVSFPDNMEITDGRMLEPGEEGIMLSPAAAAMFEEAYGHKPAEGDTIEIMATTDRAGMKIREIEYVGTFKYNNSEINPMLGLTCITDFSSLRSMLGMNLAAETVELSSEEESLIGGFSDDDLFGGGLFTDITEEGEARSAADILAEISDRSDVEALYLEDSGEWNFITIKLAGATSNTAAMKQFSEDFTASQWDVQVNDWLEGAGTQAQMSYTLKTVFNAIIAVIAIVAIIIIMNTLVISITERIPEIGTMRAIGAQKGFVRRMITAETFIITVVFGLIGIVAATAILLGLNASCINIDNMFVRMLLGGSELRPVISIQTLLLDLIGVVAIGVAASLYPTVVALRISPVTAMES